jgi:hypothetical protein
VHSAPTWTGKYDSERKKEQVKAEVRPFPITLKDSPFSFLFLEGEILGFELKAPEGSTT